MQLTVLTDTAVAPKWAPISAAASKAFEDHINEVPWVRIRKSRLLTPPGANAKLAKGSMPIYGLTLAPAGASGYQLCPWRSTECEAACLGITSGRSRFSNVQQARIAKVHYLMTNPYEFFRQLYDELYAASDRHGDNWAFRSNVLSDIPWESIAPDIYEFSPHNYDYTKSEVRAPKSLWWQHDLRLTLSYSGHNWDGCRSYLQLGGNVAMVFNTKRKAALPAYFEGFRVIDGDTSDLRWFDPQGCIVGLRAKGNIKPSPFVVHAG